MSLKRNRWLTLVAIITVLMLVAGMMGCTQSSDISDGNEGGGDGGDEQLPPIKIGIVTDTSGILQNYGNESIRGFRLGIKYATNGTNKVLGRDIEIIIEDDGGSNPEIGREKAIKLVEQDQVDFLFGTASSGVALQIIPLAEQYQKIFMVDPAAADQITGQAFSSYVFRTGSNVSQDALAGAKYAAANLGETFIHLAPDYSWGHDSAAAWNGIIEDDGGSIIDPIFVPADCKDFTPYLQRVLDSGADCLVISWAGAGGVQLFQQIAEQGVLDEMNVTTGVGDIPALKAMGFSTVGMVGMTKYYHTLPDNEVNDWFVEHYKEEYDGAVPDLFTPGGFSAAVALIKGIETAQSIAADDLIPVMEGMSFETPKGTMTFRAEDHQALQPMYIVELKEVDGIDYPVPTILEEMSAEETAPPVKK